MHSRGVGGTRDDGRRREMSRVKFSLSDPLRRRFFSSPRVTRIVHSFPSFVFIRPYGRLTSTYGNYSRPVALRLDRHRVDELALSRSCYFLGLLPLQPLSQRIHMLIEGLSLIDLMLHSTVTLHIPRSKRSGLSALLFRGAPVSALSGAHVFRYAGAHGSMWPLTSPVRFRHSSPEWSGLGM